MITSTPLDRADTEPIGGTVGTLTAPKLAAPGRIRAPARPRARRRAVEAPQPRPDPPLLHAIARSALMEIVIGEPSVIATFISALEPDGTPAAAAPRLLDELAASFPLIKWPWFRFELERAFAQLAWQARIQRRVPPNGAWYSVDAIGIDAQLPAPLTAAPHLPAPLQIDTADDLASALELAWSHYVRTVAAIQAVAPRGGDPARRASPEERSAIVDAVPWWWMNRQLGLSVASIAEGAFPRDADRRGSVYHGIRRVDAVLANPPAHRLLGSVSTQMPQKPGSDGQAQTEVRRLISELEAMRSMSAPAARLTNEDVARG